MAHTDQHDTDQSQQTPRNVLEFREMFPDEQACVQHLHDTRWPKGFICPKCGDKRGYYCEDGQIQCGNSHSTSVTANTVLHGTRTPLLIWFHGAYLMATLTPGISALQFQKQLGLTRYETAFQMLHKLRAGLVDPDKTPLAGCVESSDFRIGDTRILLAAEVATRPSEMMVGRIRACVGGADDDLKAWAKAGARATARHSHEAPWRGWHLVRHNLALSLDATHRGAISAKHMPAYLNEAVFRFDGRRTRAETFAAALRLGSRSAVWPTYRALYDTGSADGWVHPRG